MALSCADFRIVLFLGSLGLFLWTSFYRLLKSAALALYHIKLAMNANEFAPDNNSAGKVKQSHVVDSFLLIANQEFTESIEKRVSHFNGQSHCAGLAVFANEVSAVPIPHRL